MRDRAITLSKENFGEADQYVQFLTENHGMITVLARSSRKSRRRYVGGLDLFCHDEILVRGENRRCPYLVELTVLNSFPLLREHLDRITVAGRLIQWVRKLANIQSPMPLVYRLVGQSLALIEKESRPEWFSLLELTFRLKLLAFLGLKPRLDSCARCGIKPVIDDDSQEVITFNHEAGGILCSECSKQNVVTSRYGFLPSECHLLEALDSVRLGSLLRLNWRGDAMKLNALIQEFAEFHGYVRL